MNHEDRRTAVRLYAEGKTTREIVAVLGFSRITITKYLRADGVNFRKRAPRRINDGLTKGQRFYRRHPEKARAKILWRGYGLTLDDYNKMLAAQNGVCDICKNPPKKEALAVDHCHKTGTIRALLCKACNRAIGNLFENPNYADRAAIYIRRFEHLITPHGVCKTYHSVIPFVNALQVAKAKT